jgi:hypothetical protein
MIDLIVFCTHEYEWMVPPHAALLAKYAPGMRIVYYGDRQAGDLPASVEFRRAPHLGPGEDWSWAVDDWGPLGGFGVGFRACMEEYGRDVAFFTFGDFWPASPVDVGAIERLALFVPTQPDLMRVQVGWFGAMNMKLAVMGEERARWDGIRLMSVPPDDRHIGHCGGFYWLPSLWNMPLLLDFLIPECSHWGFELSHHHKMMKRPELWSCWPRPGPLYFVQHVHDRKEPGANLQYLGDEDFEIAMAALRPGTPYYRRDTGWKTA